MNYDVDVPDDIKLVLFACSNGVLAVDKLLFSKGVANNCSEKLGRTR